VLGDKGKRIRELTAVVQKRYSFPENSVELFAERVENRAACAMAQVDPQSEFLKLQLTVNIMNF